MNDLAHVGTFFLIFAAMLLLYGFALKRTGNKKLMPIQAARSVRGPEDVRRVGRIVVVIGLVVAVLSLTLSLFAGE